MKILIISGFLGAGKTTFIKSLAQKTGKEIAIFENEYGEVGLDGERLRKSLGENPISEKTDNASESRLENDKKVNIWEMTEGCICCSAKGDFASSVLTIANTVDPEYLVIEPTGVARLRDLLDNLKKIEYERIKIASAITIIDGKNFPFHRREYRNIFDNQAKNAKRLIVSKAEDMNDEEREDIRRQLNAISPDAVIETEHYSTKNDDWWQELLLMPDGESFSGSLSPEASKERENDIIQNEAESFSLSEVGIESPEKLIIFLEDALRGKYGNMVRAKGSLKAGEQNLEFDLAGTLYSLRTMPEKPEGKAVFIGKGLKRKGIREIFFEKSKYVKISYKKS